ncbi:PspC domain-containing protein [Halobacillus litoralis]|uniref:PspC domain-containing protein n=1 Tax=Halobacillus litoralis TaxID=45668 RepID=A0A845E5R1_9BACI|nr:PspC domain-containing protein [Halobacillus litoralis]MYL50033.1 PspC domain-containing protein [Halobacillus litoralis]
MKRSVTNHSLHGVCAGMAHRVGLYPMAIRLLFIFTIPFSIFLYILLANTMEADRPSL